MLPIPPERPRRIRASRAVAVLLGCCPIVVSGQERPVWEIGVAGGGAYVPDYPASGQNQSTGLVLPYAMYRGDIIRADQDGVRGEVDLSRRLQFQIGVDASFSARSRDNPQRRGLPDLDYVVEVGPSLEYRLWRSGTQQLYAVAQWRGAFAVGERGIADTGHAIEPQLVYRQRRWLGSRAELSISASSKFADRRFNGYYYDVPAAFVTPRRPAYRASGGYQQTALSSAIYWPLTPRLSIVTAQQLLLHDGAANEGSPLFRNRINVAVGFGLAYSLLVSEQVAR